MAIIRLTGADMNAGASYSGGSLPIDGDTLIVPATNLETLTNVAALTLVELAAFITERGRAKDLGTSGNKLRFNADKVIHNGSGTLYFGGGTGVSDDTDVVYINSPNTSKASVLNSDADILKVIVVAGHCEIDGSSAAIGTVQLTPIGGPGSANLLVSDGAGAITNYLQTGGHAEIHANITTGIFLGGRCQIKTTATLGTGHVAPGAIVEYFTSGTATLINNGGSLDLYPEEGSIGKTVTTLNRLPGGRVHTVSPMVTITTDNDYAAAAGIVQAVAGLVGSGGTTAI